MTLEDKLTLEDSNTSVIFLHRERNDWRAYEHSAFLLTGEVDYPFSPRVWRYRDEEIAFISFPPASLSEFLEKTAHAHIDDNFIAISARHKFDKRDWNKWKNMLT